MFTLLPVASTLRLAESIRPKFEIIDESATSNLGSRTNRDAQQNKQQQFDIGSRQFPTKLVMLNEFNEVEVNPRFKLHMKPSKPMVKVVPWDQGEKSNCFRLEIKCY